MTTESGIATTKPARAAHGIYFIDSAASAGVATTMVNPTPASVAPRTIQINAAKAAMILLPAIVVSCDQNIYRI